MKNIIRFLQIITAIVILVSCGEKNRPVPFREALNSADVRVTAMTDGQRQSLIAGNGDLYGIVWEKEGELFMRITKNDIWDARIDVSADGELPKVDIANNKRTGEVGGPPSYRKTYPQPRAAAALRLGKASVASGFLNLEKAYISILSTDGNETTIRVLKDRNVMLVNSSNDVTIEEIKAETLPPAEAGNTDGIAWLHMKMPGDIDYKGMEYAVAVASRGDLKAVSLVTSFDQPGKNVLDEALGLAKRTIEENEKSLISVHETAWNEYWNRSGVALGDSVLQRWWYRMVYFAGTVCKPGTAPMNLMAPLATDVTPWHSDYHHNYNSWQVFWPLPGINHAELADPWISYLNDMIPRFRFLAKQTYDCEGIFCPISSFLHEPDPEASQAKNHRQLSFNPWGLTLGMAGMNVQNLWQKHLYDPDKEYLREKIYPFIREAALFYASFMEKCRRDENGRVLLGPAYNPEHGNPDVYNCPFDIGYIRYTFDAFSAAASELGSDQDLVSRCREMMAVMPGYPLGVLPTGEQIVVDWEGCKPGEVAVHNITVPASPVFPCDQVTWFSPEPEKELFRRTIMNTKHNFNNSNVIFNIAKARLSMPEAVNDGKTWFQSRELPNGLFEWQGHAHGTFMGEMIGIAGLINEFLLQSAGNIIRLYPCWPAEKDASFKGLRAQGGFIVSSDFSKGKVMSATVESPAGGKLQLLSPWKTIYADGKEITADEKGIVTIDTNPGQVIQFTGN